MILQCPACDAKFKIPDGALGDDGKRVRCGKCQHVWTERPPELVVEAPVMEAVMADAAPDIDAVLAGQTHQESRPMEDIIGDFRPPKKVRSSKWKWAGYGLSYAVLLVLAGGLWSLMDKPEWWHQVPSKGFSFETIELEAMAQIGGDRFSANPMFSITGTARNVSNEPKTLPGIQVTLQDLEGEEVYRKHYTVSDKVVPPGEAVSFVLENLEQADRRHTLFIVEMGNRIELALRSVEVATDAH